MRYLWEEKIGEKEDDNKAKGRVMNHYVSFTVVLQTVPKENTQETKKMKSKKTKNKTPSDKIIKKQNKTLFMEHILI